jgi:MFS family permease
VTPARVPPDASRPNRRDASRRCWLQLILIALATLAANTVWFSASAVVEQLAADWSLTGAESAWLTLAVQLGFAFGALGVGALNLSDRFDPRHVFAAGAALAAAANAAIPVLEPPIGTVLALRFLTGVGVAGVYPTAMKLVITWFDRERGFGVGFLIGALTVGVAVPHLLNAQVALGRIGLPPWRTVMVETSVCCVAAALVGWGFLREGPHATGRAPFAWRHAGNLWRRPELRLVNFGYLGHMWELYAMWTWVPLLLVSTYEAAELDPALGRIAGFATIAAGGAGCVWAGRLADRFGRTTVTIGCLAVSGACCLLAAVAIRHPFLLTGVCLVWGFSVVADSAQFSAALSELADPRYTGTVLTVQTGAGFLLTMASIQLVPWLVENGGWAYASPVLALGPVFGGASMLRLRGRPESVRLAAGRR